VGTSGPPAYHSIGAFLHVGQDQLYNCKSLLALTEGCTSEWWWAHTFIVMTSPLEVSTSSL
jgi:hypothetical protein